MNDSDNEPEDEVEIVTGHVRIVTHSSTVTVHIGWLIFGALLVIAVGLAAWRFGHGHK
ncbi:MAG TPA: hypothetical protein VFA07_18915 [Chthonomonadaceae bacterium]|nr:hypothetical protein [Chthonomonadaceae bacterium]